MLNKPWTFMVYLAGDNNLTEEMAWSLQELKMAADRLDPQASQINVVAHFNPEGSRSRRYDFLPRSPINSPATPAQDDGNLNKWESVINPEDPTQESKLQAFISEHVSHLPPADEFFLVLSGHGSGAVGDFLIDLDPTTSMSIPELRRILELGRSEYQKKHPERKGRRIGVLGMDSCLMSNAEVCFEIREHAQYLVGSEGWVPHTGWPYHRVLEAMVDPVTKTPVLAPDDVAKRVARSYASFYRDYEVSGVSTDIAVCDLSEFGVDGSLVGALRAFARECIPRLEAEYVNEVLRRVPVEPERMKGLVRLLSYTVAQRLVPDEAEAQALAESLFNGSQGALAELQAGAWTELTASQVEALRGFLDSWDLQYHLGDDVLEQRLKAHAERLKEELQKPSSRHVALAAVRVLREFDPGMLQAAKLVESLRAKEGPLAKLIRGELQKLHQMQWLLDLHRLLNAASLPDHAPIRDALVAARWEAQAFKGGIYVDLVDLCRCLEKRVHVDDPLRQLCVDVREAIEGTDDGRKKPAVLLSRYTGPAFQHAHGLSAYFPVQAADYSSEYENLELAEQTGWGRLVRAYLCVTRRGRRDEGEHWVNPDHQLQRYCERELDPLEVVSIEARIAGVSGPPSGSDRFFPRHVRAGTEKRIREAMAVRIREEGENQLREALEQRIREGIETKLLEETEVVVCEGTEKRIREGTENRIRAANEQGILEGVEDTTREGTENRIRAAIEQRILESVEDTTREGTEKRIREGTEKRIRESTERRIREGTEKRIREGTEKRIREGTEKRIREGTEKRIKGEGGGAPLLWGNPPDGFFKQDG